MRVASDFDAVLAVLLQAQPELPANWARRYRLHRGMVADGSPIAMAGVVRNLTRQQHERGLSVGEHELLRRARESLVREIAEALGIAPSEASRTIDDALA